MKIHFKKMKFVLAAVGMAMVVQSTPLHASSLHVAKEGDTYYKLSQQYAVNMDKLMKANPKTKADNIYAGIKLNIPTSGNVVKAASLTNTASILTTSSNKKEIEAWGKTFNYSKTLKVKATAYSAAASENGKWGAVDYFGNSLELGTIAVDPSIIPFGTKVLVTGHSHNGLPKDAFVATASDAGSAIKGNRIDIFIPGSQQSVRVFGYQDIELYFID
ncbi:3D domain-containing protein [Paenibacillus crassostreae]|uniref:LysM domain-containing protein n=1 Tax=Paenibacillus crassostreae TaxID=1763538 RepID=A0A162KVU9_9BACL|nr:3D domain-containing protein [Paenibacillus crassostreae]AOZ91065.1 hypothetical protein LPB68_01835 [Paenibacillus crassostreae]OAB74773.1 hypothetical protein PNBC_12120 [Paenibacillus crassostreae]